MGTFFFFCGIAFDKIPSSALIHTVKKKKKDRNRQPSRQEHEERQDKQQNFFFFLYNFFWWFCSITDNTETENIIARGVQGAALAVESNI